MIISAFVSKQNKIQNTKFSNVDNNNNNLQSKKEMCKKKFEIIDHKTTKQTDYIIYNENFYASNKHENWTEFQIYLFFNYQIYN